MLLPGCERGRPHYPASGTVTFKKDGQRATFGNIEFRSEEEPVVVARGKIQKDGTFTVNAGQQKGTVGGWHTVVILQQIRDLGVGHMHAHGLDAAQKYADHRTTDLRVEVDAETTDGLKLIDR